jgi:hypothetical protein
MRAFAFGKIFASSLCEVGVGDVLLPSADSSFRTMRELKSRVVAPSAEAASVIASTDITATLFIMNTSYGQLPSIYRVKTTEPKYYIDGPRPKCANHKQGEHPMSHPRTILPPGVALLNHCPEKTT